MSFSPKKPPTRAAFLLNPAFYLVIFSNGDILHDGLGAVEEDGEGEIVGLHAVDLIVGAQRDLVHVAEHVELREGDARRTTTFMSCRIF